MPYTDEELLVYMPKESEEDKRKKKREYSDEELLAYIPKANPQEQQQSMLEYARGSLKESWFPGIKATAIGLGAIPTSMIARITGQGEAADYINRFSDAFQQAKAETDVGGPVTKSIKRGLRGVGMTLPTAILSGPAGPYAVIGQAAATEANQAITEGRDAGLKEAELFNYAATQGYIEGSVAAAFQLVGLGGAENIIGGKAAVASGVSSALKQAGIATMQELPEEIITELGHSVARSVSGVDPNATSPGQLARTAADTTVQTLLTMGAIGAGQVLSAKTQQDIFSASESGKTPSRVQWKKWGFDPEKGKTAKARSEGLQAVAESLKQEQVVTEPTQQPTQQEAIQEPLGRAWIPNQQQQKDISKRYIELGGRYTGPNQLDLRDDTKFQQARQEVEQAAQEPIEQGIPFVQESTEGVSAEGRVVQEQALQPETWQETETPKQKGEVAQFIESTAGRIGISVEALSKPLGFVKHAAQRFLTSQGELPTAAYNEKVKRDGRISRIQREMALHNNDLKKAVKEAFPGRAATPREIHAIDDALHGMMPLESMPEAIREPLGQLRNDIDAYSRRGIALGAFAGKMEGTIIENEGMYVTRSYQIFTDPKWADKVPKETRNKAAAYLRSMYPDKTEPEIQGLIENLLFRGPGADTPMAILHQSKLGAKDLSILTQRKGIPREIRELWGEYHDPFVNYAISVTKVGNLVANHEFLTEVRKQGLGTFLSETPVINENSNLVAKLAADESSTMAPLNGLYTTPEIRDAFVRATETTHNPAWLAYVLAANATVKISKTIGSLMTHVRNTLGNPFICLANGHWHVGETKHAFKAVMNDLMKKSDVELRSYYLEAVEYGVADQDVHASELRAHIKDASLNELDEWTYSLEQKRAAKAKRLLKKGVEIPAKMYAAEDTVWKLYAWENEKIDYRAAYPEWSEEQLKRETADHVRNIYPTWGKVPEGIQLIRRFPLVGNFVSFPAEIYRNAYHRAILTKQELTNPRTRSVGAKRLAGQVAAYSLTSGLAYASLYTLGMTGDDDKDMRWFVPPWQKNSPLVYIKKPENGVARYLDMSYTDPHNYLITPIWALLKNEDPAKGLWEGFKDIAEPFVGEEILAGKMLDIARNSDNGRQVYNPQDTVDQQAKDVTAHLWSAFEPGTITSGRRIAAGVQGTRGRGGRIYNPTVESLAVATGQRIQDVDVAQSLQFRARDYMRNYREAQSIWLSTITSKGNVSEGDIRSAWERTEKARSGLFRDMSEAANAAVRLGVEKNSVVQVLDNGGISTDIIRQLFSGVYRKQVLTMRHAKAVQAANTAEAAERLQTIRELVNSGDTVE